MTTEQKLEQAIEILKNIHGDASMALNGDWDRSDDGFEAQQYVIESFFNKMGIEIEEMEKLS